jgi:hypothetical protein
MIRKSSMSKVVVDSDDGGRWRSVKEEEDGSC